MIITRTPFRLSLFGGGTDYRPWFENNGGLVIAAAMNHYCYLTVRNLSPFFDHKSRAAYSQVELVGDNGDFEHPSINQTLKYLGFDSGVQISHDGDLPARSGIGSSSSFTVGLLNALNALRYKMSSKQQLAEAAIEVEQKWIKEDVGIQDQIMSAYGGLRVIRMEKNGTYSVDPIICKPEYLENFEKHVMIGFSGVSRFAVKYAKSQIENIKTGTSAKSLHEIQDMAKEALGLFTGHADMSELGALLHKGWLLKRGLAEGLTNDFIDETYNTAIKAGAYGGKLMGAGGGGFFMFLAPPEKQAQVKAALSAIKVWVPFKIDFNGSQVIFQHDTTH